MANSSAMDTGPTSEAHEISAAAEVSSIAYDEENQKQPIVTMDVGAEGAKRSELMQEVWGKHGKLLIFVGLGIFMLVYELDNYTFGTYYIYAISDFKMTSREAALTTACNLTFSLLKPVWAKMSDVWGRGPMYPLALIFALVGMAVAASAQGFNAFAAGTIIRIVGTTAFNSLNTIIISDFTSTRARGFGVNFQWFPAIILPWCVSYLISAVVSPGGIGWAWGIGMVAIMFPFGTAMIATLLLVYERRASKIEIEGLEKPKTSVMEIISSMDLMGISIIVFGCAFILIPLSLASNLDDGYRTPWVIALMTLGALMLIGLPFYENTFAAHPFLPMRYLKHKAICMGFILYFTDYMSAAASHIYLYNWAVIAKDMSIVAATNLSYINGVMTFVTGMIFGAVVYKTRRFKWIIVGGLVIRLIGYGVMFRVRTSNPSAAEIFVVQFVQGIGDGIVQSGGYIIATINVPHRETAQMAALIVTIGMLGSSVGSAICGAIYTGTMRQELTKALGDNATPELIENLYNSITTGVPDWGTPQRAAIASAYDTVTSYFFIAAIVIIIPGFIIGFFIPNQTLNDNQNLVEDHGMFGQKIDGIPGTSEGVPAIEEQGAGTKPQGTKL
ncbi:MFS general substrate transporter [Thozetella sp. PMI_491]|nr:MFS general substrate transporter [Thozetella sp. PMI_491]